MQRPDRLHLHFNTEEARWEYGSHFSKYAELWKFGHRLKAKVINDCACLCITHTVSSPPLKAWQFSYGLARSYLPICQHLPLFSPEFYGRRETSGLKGPNSLFGDPSKSCAHRGFKNKVRSCYCCFADFEVSLEVSGEEKGGGSRRDYVRCQCVSDSGCAGCDCAGGGCVSCDVLRCYKLDITSYHWLGSCRTPFDLEWALFVRRFLPDETWIRK